MVCLAHAAAPGKKKKKYAFLQCVQFATNVLASVIFFQNGNGTERNGVNTRGNIYVASTHLKAMEENEMIYRALNLTKLHLILRLGSAITRKYDMGLPLPFPQLGVLLFQRANIQSESFTIAAGCHGLQRSERLWYTICERVFFFFLFLFLSLHHAKQARPMP